MVGTVIESSLNLANFKATNRECVIQALSNKLLNNDCVLKTFPEAILKREVDFPTGLPTDIPIAIPHAEAQYCKRAAIAIATLERPVVFLEMGNPEKELQVQIVFMLSIINPNSQITWLKKLTTIFGDTTKLNQLLTASSAETLAEVFKELIGSNSDSA